MRRRHQRLTVAVTLVVAAGLACKPAPRDMSSSSTTTTTTTTVADGDGDPETTGDGNSDTTGDSDSETTGDGDPGDGDSTGSETYCGDGVVQVDEECDLGPQNSDSGACTTSCNIAVCGDGLRYEGFEECDDGDDDNDNDCANDCTWNGCRPSGQRAPFDTLGVDTASGCWDGNPCAYDQYSWYASHGQNYQGFDQSVSCTGTATCVNNVGITTYSEGDVCQGRFDIYCDGYMVGQIDTIDIACVGSAMNNECRVSFAGRMCSEIEVHAAMDDDEKTGCCDGNNPDSMVTSISAW